MRLVPIAIILLALVGAQAAAAPPSGSLATPVSPQARETATAVRIAARSPLTIHVTRRSPGARVRVVLTVQGRSFARAPVARADGVAVLRLAGVVLGRCQPVYVRLGGPYARLQILRLPSRDCAPTT